MKTLRVALLAALFLLISCSSFTRQRAQTEVRDIDMSLDESTAPVLTVEELSSVSAQIVAYLDQTRGLAPTGSMYSNRLSRLVGGYTNIDGLQLDYRAYVNPQISVFAFPDGAVRVFGGAMELMDDNELLFLLGNQIGHVKLGHTKRRLEVAYAAVSQREASGTSLSGRQLVEITRRLHQARYAQSQEEAADIYALTFLKQYGYDTRAAISALSKIAELGERQGLFATGPVMQARIGRVERELSGSFQYMEEPAQQPESEAMVVAEEEVIVDEEPEAVVVVEEEVVVVEEPEAMVVEEVDTLVVAEPQGVIAEESELIAVTAPEPVLTKTKRRNEVKTATLSRSSAVPASVEKATPAPQPQVPSPPAQEEGSALQQVPSGWYLQIAADTDELEAFSRVNFLKSLEIPARIEEATVNNVFYHRVLVGPYSSRAAAEALGPKIKGYGITGGAPFVKQVK